MLAVLAADQATIVETAKRVIRDAESAGDAATVDLLVRRIDTHEKNAWMLNSSR
jgi:starvation-inducible DNA-binding protein